jgi:excisionase family DNA binding protein
MNITPSLPEGYSGPIKQLTCQVCKQAFYITWTDYIASPEISYCRTCSVIEARNKLLSTGEYRESGDGAATFQPLLTVQQVMDALQLGRTKVYTLIAREGLPVIRFGRSVRVSPKALQEWLEQRERQR